MAHFIDSLVNTKAKYDSGWYIAKPMISDIPSRIRDAWKVLRGEYIAVSFFHSKPAPQKEE